MSTQTERLAKGCAKVVSLLLVVCFAFSFYLTLRSGIVPGLNPYIDNRKDEIIDIAIRRKTVSGEIFDANGKQITKANDAGQAASLLYEECFSHLIKYASKGLENKYYRDLRIDEKDHVGADIHLTINADLQEFCYKQLADKEGSIIVINSETGEILACASRSSTKYGYSDNTPDEAFAGEKNDFLLNRATLAEDTAGSTMKIVTAAAMIENGMKKYKYDDTKGEYIVNGYPIHNYGNKAYGKDVDIECALNNSVNTFFASASVELGKDKLEETADKFLLGKDIELDFTTLTSIYDLGNGNDNFPIAQAGFGQGAVSVSPLQITFFMSAVLNKGEIMKPYLIQNIVNNSETEYEAKEKVLSKAISKSTANALKEALHSTAIGYGFDEKTYGKNIYAKSGTAEIENGKANSNYCLVGVETESGKYTILVNERNSQLGSSSVYKAENSPAKSVVRYVISM